MTIRSIRNSWVEIETSSRKNPIATGPADKEGWLWARFFVRAAGQSIKSVTVSAFVLGNEHTLIVYDPDDKEIFRHVTELEMTQEG